MDSFHRFVINNPKSNKIGGHNYGETIIHGSISEQTALRDFSKIVFQFKKLVNSKGGMLNIVSLECQVKNTILISKNTQKLLRNNATNFKLIA